MRHLANIRLRFPIVKSEVSRLFSRLTVNSSIRSIIRQFSTTVNSRKTSRFTGVHRMVNALKTHCFPLFCRSFPVTKQRVNWCLWEFSLIYFMFTARLRPVQTLATLLGPTCCERLHTMLCVVACCCDLLEVVG